MVTVISAILIFCVLIFIHEFGHFITAKLFKMTVHEFSIGMGPTLFAFDKNGTSYSLRAFPIGGFVRLEGEDGQSDDANAFCNKSIIARIAVLASGAFMNFVLGFLIFVFVLSGSSGYASNKIGEIVENSAFYNADVMVGDKIVRMKSDKYSSKIEHYSDILLFNYKSGALPATITFERDGERFVKEITPQFSEPDNRYLYGFKAFIEPKSFFGTIKYSIYQSKYVVKVVTLSLMDLIKGEVSPSEMSGPVGIVNEIGNAAKMGLLSVLNLAALISINLGVMNLLPIPALDGGRLLFVLIEGITRKKIPHEKEAFIHAVGFMILIGFMLIITYFDLSKL